MESADIREIGNMNSEKKWPFLIQLITLVGVPLTLVMGNIPNNVINQNDLLATLYNLSFVFYVLYFLFAIPAGVIGIYNSKKGNMLPKLKTITLILSILNIIVGGITIGIIVLILIAALIGVD